MFNLFKKKPTHTENDHEARLAELEYSVFQLQITVIERLQEIIKILESKKVAVVEPKKPHGNLGKKYNTKPTKCPCGYKAKTYRGLQIHITKSHGTTA